MLQNKEMFRKVALDRMASPERLDTLMRVTTPRIWMALLGIGSLLFLGVIWLFFARVDQTVTAAGNLVETGDFMEVEASVPVDQMRGVEPGIKAHISPVNTLPQEVGYLEGYVIAVAGETQEQDGVSMVQVTIALDREGDHYQWTVGDGAELALIAGTPCTVNLIVEEDRLISRFLPIFE